MTASIFTATRKVRNQRGNYYLTHGGDTADHKGMNKARRSLDTALIQEGLSELGEEPILTFEEPTSFRLVIDTQYHENYGAHDWDGEGECPQHWKPKGGSEYHISLGSANDVIALGSKGIAELVAKAEAKVCHSNESSIETLLGWEIVPSNVKTYEEEFDEWDGRKRDRTLKI